LRSSSVGGEGFEAVRKIYRGGWEKVIRMVHITPPSSRPGGEKALASVPSQQHACALTIMPATNTRE